MDAYYVGGPLVEGISDDKVSFKKMSFNRAITIKFKDHAFTKFTIIFKTTKLNKL